MKRSAESTQAPQTRTHHRTRREFLSLVGAATTLATFAPPVFAASPGPGAGGRGRPGQAVARFVYVGTYTAPNTAPGGVVPSTAVGISVFKMDPRDGGLAAVQTVATPNPSFLALDPTTRFLYATNELGPGQEPIINGTGRFSAWAINPANGQLSPINDVNSLGTFPAHLSVHPSGTYLLGSNYGTGNFPIYEILPNGSIGENTDTFQDTGNGTGPNPARQEGPHAHMILTDPGVQHVFGVDLGADKVMAWTLALTGPDAGKLIPNTVPYAGVASGAGCRHMAFHPSQTVAYVINELVSSIDVFAVDPARGAFVWRQTISTLPSRFTGTSTTAEIRVHPSGQWVYGTNRGHNTVAIFKVDETTGMLSVVGWESTRGEIPRGMNLDPSGTFLYAGNQNSDTIAVFRVNAANGKLTLNELVHTPVPVDIEFGAPV